MLRKQFSNQPLLCSICGIKFLANIRSNWQGFKYGVCGEKCYWEKKYREGLSILNQPYRPSDPKIKNH